MEQKKRMEVPGQINKTTIRNRIGSIKICASKLKKTETEANR